MAELEYYRKAAKVAEERKAGVAGAKSFLAAKRRKRRKKEDEDLGS